MDLKFLRHIFFNAELKNLCRSFYTEKNGLIIFFNCDCGICCTGTNLNTVTVAA